MITRWVLLCLLALGVVLMHHTGAEAEPPPTAHATHAAHTMAEGTAHGDEHRPADGHPAPGGGHDLLHLCLAVAVAAGFALALTLLSGRLAAGRAPGPRGAVVPRSAARAPPRPGGRDLLHLACVLRV
ncbi:hypothetical protein B0I33_109121 [Prauserella shujinwangii]|uniref:Uncharacterized protein n=1 Tax=Prauserella shujinwangii TaxID=1453103 RepID=A0A2T0LQ32_9PSEU|nr:DUF6153 family protein [Prauserella shujinwangii]PRX45458.1 hypothetical protein B0I33_109121 [Prauserella shujinwangii]